MNETGTPTGRLALARLAEWGVELAAYPYPGGFNYYPIEWNRLDSPEKLVRWIRHLTGKLWFSPDMCHALICVVAEHFDWRLEGLP